MDISAKIIGAADKCVQCGLCSQHCPTYLLTQQEAESARGRISLMKALAENKIDLSEPLQAHLSHCLSCRACEAVCPAQVPYGQLIDDTRAMLFLKQATTGYQALPNYLKLITFYPFLLRLLHKILYLYQRSGLQWLARHLRLLKLLKIDHIDALLPSLPWQLLSAGFYPTRYQEKGRIGLFTGCIASLVDKQTLTDTIKVLNCLGYSVYIPRSQQCCGALHLHAGDRETADILSKQNILSFNGLAIDAIVSCATGCGVVLQNFASPQQPIRGFAKKVYDINHFLTKIPWPAHLDIKPLLKHAAVHSPCSMRNVMKEEQFPISLVQRIPQLTLTALQSNNICCGAAGAYFLQHPDIAANLVEKIILELKNNNFDLLLTSNIGCSLHIARAIKKHHLNIEIIHPVSLLARQLGV